jgi:hypothetical protein
VRVGLRTGLESGAAVETNFGTYPKLLATPWARDAVHLDISLPGVTDVRLNVQ